jgi:hypothetical protein
MVTSAGGIVSPSIFAVSKRFFQEAIVPAMEPTGSIQQ